MTSHFMQYVGKHLLAIQCLQPEVTHASFNPASNMTRHFGGSASSMVQASAAHLVQRHARQTGPIHTVLSDGQLATTASTVVQLTADATEVVQWWSLLQERHSCMITYIMCEDPSPSSCHQASVAGTAPHLLAATPQWIC